MSEPQIIEATLPLSMNEIKSFYAEKDNTKFVVDYDKSSLKGKGFLFYVANLDLPVHIKFNGATETADIFGLIHDYMSISTICNIDTLHLTVAQVLLEHRGVTTSDIIENPILTADQARQFAEQHPTLIETWTMFLDSLVVFMLSVIYQPDFDKSKYEVVNDPTLIGNNVVNLFKIPSFLELYYSTGINKSNLQYFEYQFEQYCFGGKNLFYHFTQNKDSWLLTATIMSLLLSKGRELSAASD